MPESKAKREQLAQEMVRIIGDTHSLGFYRKTAQQYSPQVIFDALGRVRESWRERSVRKNKGALFVAILRSMREERSRGMV